MKDNKNTKSSKKKEDLREKEKNNKLVPKKNEAFNHNSQNKEKKNYLQAI